MVPDIIDRNAVRSLFRTIKWIAYSTCALGFLAYCALLFGLIALKCPTGIGVGAFAVGFFAVFGVALLIEPVGVEMEVLEDSLWARGRWRGGNTAAGSVGIGWRISAGAAIDALFVAALLIALSWYGGALQQRPLAWVVGGSALALTLLLAASLLWVRRLAGAAALTIGPGEQA